jgi:hypothetical protein
VAHCELNGTALNAAFPALRHFEKALGGGQRCRRVGSEQCRGS